MNILPRQILHNKNYIKLRTFIFVKMKIYMVLFLKQDSNDQSIGLSCLTCGFRNHPALSPTILLLLMLVSF